jgi:hypothetical protein
MCGSLYKNYHNIEINTYLNYLGVTLFADNIAIKPSIFILLSLFLSNRQFAIEIVH